MVEFHKLELDAVLERSLNNIQEADLGNDEGLVD